MNTNKNTALYEKMAAEQDKFRDWLKSQPPEEILNHAYEYTVREDILMAMEELDLPQSRAAALLASPSPLADVYKEFADRETSYMDVVRDSIEQRAEAALDAQRELPLYRHDAAYAREQGDLDLYRASRRANIACKEAIEASLSEHYRDNRLDRDAVPQVIEQFGYTRTRRTALPAWKSVATPSPIRRMPVRRCWTPARRSRGPTRCRLAVIGALLCRCSLTLGNRNIRSC